MRILLTADPELPVPPTGYGGIERIAAELLAEFRVRGHTVGLAAREGSMAEVDAFFPWPGRESQRRKDTIANARALHGAVRRFRPDVLQSFSRLAYLLPLFALAPRLPKIMSYQRHTGGNSVRLATVLGGKHLHFTGCSEAICRMGRPAGGRWTAIPNFVDTQTFPFQPAVPSDAPLLFLSRIEAIKGAHLAIEIARRSGRRLIIAGNRVDSEEGAAYFDREIAPHLGRGIEWIGEVDNAQKRQQLMGAAALVVPIQWDEPFGIVFAEALAAGVPVITCARGATPEIIEEGRTGFFIRDVAEGVQAVARLAEIDRAKCRMVAEHRFDVTVVAKQYLQLYASIQSG